MIRRPFHPAYHPWAWRNWLDFGTGLLGDLGLRTLSTVFKALKLGHPVSVEASATKLSSERPTPGARLSASSFRRAALCRP